MLALEIKKTIRFDKAALQFSNLENYDRITMPGLELEQIPGSPQLPVCIFHWTFPQQRVVQIEISSVRQEILPGKYFILPGQPPQTLTSLSVQKNITLQAPDISIYSSAVPYPQEIIKNLGSGRFQGTEVVALAVYPLQYLPAEKKLIFYSEIELKLVLESAPVLQPPAILTKGLTKLAENCLLPELGSEPENEPFDEYYPYIIITSKIYRDSFLPLAQWKTQKGLNTKIVELSTILNDYTGRDDAEKIRNFIKYAQSNWGTTWVLLGGDTDVVPARSAFAMDCQYGARPDENAIPCDLYYADLDGDWDANGNNIFGEVADTVDLYPEVYLGRAALNSVSEAEAWVNKVIQYEKNPSLTYLKKLLFLCQVLWDVPYTDTGIGKDRIEERYLSENNYSITKLYESLENLNKTSALQQLNAGQNIINHSGHAWWTVLSLGDGSLKDTDMLALNNRNRPSTIYSIGCWPAAIDYDCVAEAFLANPNGGGVAFIGNSRYGWGSPGNPGYGYSDRFDEKFFYFLFNQKTNSIGEALALAKAFYVPFARQENVYRWCLYEINLLGDPEMPLWTDEPESLQVDFPKTIVTGSSQLLLTVTSKSRPVVNARVCLKQADNLYLIETTDESGVAFFQVETSNAADPIMITITAENFLPAIGTIAVSMDEPYLYCDRVVVADELTNNDGFLNPGETVSLSLNLKNRGSMDIDSLTLDLAADSAGLRVLSAPIFLEHIAGLDSVLIENTFSVQASAASANGDVLYPRLSIFSKVKNWSQRLALPIGTPCFTLSDFDVHDANDNQHLEAGESVRIILSMKNSGLAPATNFAVNVCSQDSYLNIQSNNFYVSQFLPNSIVTDSIDIVIAENCPTPSFPAISLSGSFSAGDSFRTSFVLAVGKLSFFDNIEVENSSWSLPEPASNQWHRSTIRAHSGDYSWYCGQETDTTYRDNNLSELISPEFVLGRNARLSFWLWYDVAIYSVNGYEGDGVHVEISTGENWQTLDFIGTGGALPPFLMGNDWLKYEYDLSAFAAATSARLRFRFISDPFWQNYPQRFEGMYLDDVAISSSLASQLSEEEIPLLPEKFELCQNYPSPFNNYTTINYKIPIAANNSNVLIQIYNITGQRIKLLLDRRHNAGEYRVVWDGTDFANRSLPSGVYFYRLTVANKFDQVNKLILLK